MVSVVGHLQAHLWDLRAQLTWGNVTHGHVYVPKHRKALSLLPM